MPRAVKEPWRCKARDRRTGKRCVNKAIGNHGMCLRHRRSSLSTGAKTKAGKAKSAAAGEGNATHGIYAATWTEAEQARAKEMEAATLQHSELVQLRISLSRVQRYIQRLEAGDKVIDSREESNEADGVPIGADGRPVAGQAPKKVKVTSKTNTLSLHDAYTLADRYINSIARVSRVISELLQLPTAGGDPSSEALIFKEMLTGFMDISGGKLGEMGYAPQPSPAAPVPPSNGNGRNGNGKAH